MFQGDLYLTMVQGVAYLLHMYVVYHLDAADQLRDLKLKNLDAADKLRGGQSIAAGRDTHPTGVLSGR